ncbi:CocE/NonD family hydrolase [Parasediminibacterium sp. JCM 36343]|uniref:CocE/NonD family hydrolase n=1 Tax=Parasediminibacterium sp. JCM 36343 TaxID=3374279 RepID=UPI00397C5AB3
MRKLLMLILLLPLLAVAQNADSLWIMKHYAKKEVMIPMRDGVKLFTSIYVPKDNTEKHPFLLTRTPYSCAPYGEDNFRRVWYSSYAMKYYKEGYIIIKQDVRGRWMSEGVFQDIRPFNPNKKGKEIDEASDTYDTVDWLLANIGNNNGNVGVFGISYPGFYSTMAALCNHPAIKAVSPQAPVTDWFAGDDTHHNGALFLMDEFGFDFSFGKPHPRPTKEAAKEFDFPTKDSYDFYLRTGALPNFSRLIGDSCLFWHEVMNHPVYDDWWKARNPRNFVDNIKTNTLVVGGLFDAEDCFGTWNLYKAIEANGKAASNKLVIGPWFHGQWASNDGTHLGNVQFGSNTAKWYQNNIELPYFNYYLKGQGSLDFLAKATIFFSGSNEWKKLPQWPPAGMKPTDFYLQANGGLSSMQSKMKPLSSYTEYISDPAKPVPYTQEVTADRTREYMTDDQRFAARRTDVLAYQSPVLSDDITVAGPLVADLLVSISTTDADFIVKLIDVFPDSFDYSAHDTYVMNGYQMLVRGDIMRGKFRNSLEKPEPFVPNQPTQVKYTMPDIAHTFKKGHRIMVQIQSSWFPLVDRNPQQFLDIYHAKDEDFKKATIRVYENQSKVVLPIW